MDKQEFSEKVRVYLDEKVRDGVIQGFFIRYSWFQNFQLFADVALPGEFYNEIERWAIYEDQTGEINHQVKLRY